MATVSLSGLPSQCPACAGPLVITRLQCSACGTKVAGAFAPAIDRLINVPEPHGSLLEMFLRSRGNAKEMERELGLSYPTVRARLEEAFAAAGLGKDQEQAGTGSTGKPPARDQSEASLAARRAAVLDALARKELWVPEAARQLRELRAPRGERTTQ